MRMTQRATVRHDGRATGSPPHPGPELQDGGLSEAEAARRLAARPPAGTPSTSRSYASIVRANVLTIFNLVLAAFGAVTLAFGDPRDALFLGIIVANSGIGIVQEVRAKHALDRLSLLVAPRANVLREGSRRLLPVEDVVPGDVVLLAPGDQVVADGTLRAARELRLDESILTGESQSVTRRQGEEVRSGAFVAEGTGAYEVEAVGLASFAARLTGEARLFRHPRSPLELAVNRLLYALIMLVLLLGAVLGYSLYHRHASLRTAVSTSSAGVVSLIPEGLMLLVSLTYAAASVRMSRRGVLAQQLNAIESLASVDTICIDKTGTLTQGALRVVETVPAPGLTTESLDSELAAFAASASARNPTLAAIAEAFPSPAEVPRAEVPFSSRRRWSAVQRGDESLYLGAPGRVPAGHLADLAADHQRHGRRVLALARDRRPLSGEPGELPPQGMEPVGLVVLAEGLRPNIKETISFLRQEGIAIKVLSGDAPETVAAIARDVGIKADEVSDGQDIPTDPAELARFARSVDVVGRISPEGKQSIVRTLTTGGGYVAMVGDGVNDVPALKASRLAIAQGTGTQMARAVADLVLVSGDFAVVPLLVAEGRRSLRNLQRVTKLYVTKSAFAAFLIVSVGTSTEAYPLLPRHLSLAATLTIGIPTFFLALASSSGPWRPTEFVRTVARFAVPAGLVLGTGLVAGYLFARHDLDMSVAQARTVGLTTLVVGGLFLVMALEAGGSTRRSALVGVMCVVMFGLYVTAFVIPGTRTFFALTPPDVSMVLTAVIATALTIGALWLCGFTLYRGAGGRLGGSPGS